MTPAAHEVRLTAAAEQDLHDIWHCIARTSGAARAGHVQDRLLALIESLAHLPERGAHPRELLALGMREFRQVGWKPYRVVYRVIGQQVFVLLVADGRRHMQRLLARRLLSA
ncbi:MAG: type II toxin-antitoxin system RelE/ParE family toxin [Pseudomonadota bacterium]|nr:type II toxin-antitoxin system RelE/ParE family toxin [Pseudomonadota bacterium]